MNYYLPEISKYKYKERRRTCFTHQPQPSLAIQRMNKVWPAAVAWCRIEESMAGKVEVGEHVNNKIKEKERDECCYYCPLK